MKFSHWIFRSSIKLDTLHPYDDYTIYHFYLRDGAPEKLTRCVSVKDDDAIDDSDLGIIEVVEYLITVFKRYIYAKAKKELLELLDYLVSVAPADFLDKLAYDVQLAEYNLEQASKAHGAAVETASYYEDGRAT